MTTASVRDFREESSEPVLLFFGYFDPDFLFEDDEHKWFLG